jgi:hypothetical protein
MHRVRFRGGPTLGRHQHRVNIRIWMGARIDPVALQRRKSTQAIFGIVEAK